MSIQKFIKKKTQSLFNRGLTSRELAISIAVAILLTTFPFYGLTTIVLAGTAVKLKLNLPFTLTISYLMEPLRFLLFIPFIKTGNILFKINPVLPDISMIKEHILNTPVKTIALLFHELFYAMIGWCVIAIPFSFMLYLILKKILPLLKREKLDVSGIPIENF